ncbi:MAG: diaminopimelate epimerase [Phycisphaerae bacterium]
MAENKPIALSKLSGSGNDFICIANLDGSLDALLDDPEKISRFAQTLCHRGTGVGADGVIVASQPEIPEAADISARFLEADGTEAELCGNGTACFVRWVCENEWVKTSEVRILTPAGVVLGKTKEDKYIQVCIPLPEDIRRGESVNVEGKNWTYDFAVTGVPHLVTYVKDLENLDMERWGPALRHHPKFQPRGVNANFVEPLDEGELMIRTFEFGVEGETLACGTGSATAAFMAAQRFGWSEEYTKGEKPVLMHARSGDVLKVIFTMEEGALVNFCLETRVRFAYVGSLHPDLAERALPEIRTSVENV